MPAAEEVATPAPVFIMEGVRAGYGDGDVLREISISVPEGRVAVVLGPNGAGKTTLLRAASGLLPPSAGTLTFRGEVVTRKNAHQLAQRGMCHIPEGRGIFPSMTVSENLVLFSIKGQEGGALERAADAFPFLRERAGQVAGSMSGGEQQMLALVRAYLTDPKLVLVDEASMGLAPLIVDQLFEFLGRLAGTGTSLLVVEQYVDRALELADIAYVLNRGALVFAGTAEKLRETDIFETYLGSGAPG